jgi:ATP-dependent protease HslVU (ClpYQ) peptidase subunit
MSIAVAVRKGRDLVLAADTQTSFGSYTVSIKNHRAVKVRKVGSAYIATTGPGIYEDILQDVFAKNPRASLANKRAIFAFFQKLWRDLHEHYPFVNDQWDRDEKSPFGDLDASFLVINREGIFYVASDTSISQFDKYFAIGSGADFSLGALFALYDLDLDAETLATTGVKAAMEFNLYCGGDITTSRIRLRS